MPGNPRYIYILRWQNARGARYWKTRAFFKRDHADGVMAILMADTLIGEIHFLRVVCPREENFRHGIKYLQEKLKEEGGA